MNDPDRHVTWQRHGPFGLLLVFNFTFWLLVFGLHHRRWIIASEIAFVITAALGVSLFFWRWLYKNRGRRVALSFVLVANFVFWLLMFGLDRRTWTVASEVALATTGAVAAILFLWGWLETS